MKVEIWSDVACPWCYIGKVRFEKALAAYESADEVEVVWRSFQLQPDAPRKNPVLTVNHLAEKYGVGLKQANEMMGRVTEMAAGEGLEFHLDKALAASTFDAQRLVHFAKHDAGTEPATALMNRLMQAYQSEGANVADHETLLKLAVEVGLDGAESARVLASDEHADDVRADLERGHNFGISGVPFFVIDEKHGISGAQPTELFLRALQQLGPQPEGAVKGEKLASA